MWQNTPHMKEQDPSRQRAIKPDPSLSVDCIHELIYQNEANENPIERDRRDDELYELLDFAQKLEVEN